MKLDVDIFVKNLQALSLGIVVQNLRIVFHDEGRNSALGEFYAKRIEAKG